MGTGRKKRVYVCLHLFAGERRAGDLQDHLQRKCEEEGLPLFAVSADLATDSRWALSNEQTFAILYDCCCKALIDCIPAGHPCFTISPDSCPKDQDQLDIEVSTSGGFLTSLPQRVLVHMKLIYYGCIL